MSMLTEPQIESVARKYCEIAELDPEKLIQEPVQPNEFGEVLSVVVMKKQWYIIAKKVKERNMMDEAIRLAE